MRPLDLLPPPGPLPKEGQEEYLNRALHANYLALERMKQILSGDCLIASAEGNLANTDTAVVDVVIEQAYGTQVDNPLDREPVGVITLIGPGFVAPKLVSYPTTLSVTADSKTVTCSTSFSTQVALGYLIAQTHFVKVLERVDSTTMTLQDPWPGTTDAAETGQVMHHWDADYVWLYAYGTASYPGWYRLLFL